MNVPDRLRHQDRPPVPARANQNASRAKADQLQWQFRRGAESKEGGGALWRGAEATSQWAFQSAQRRPMVGEHRNPRRCEPIDAVAAGQWERRGGVP